jgi:F-box associated protein
MMCQGKTCKGLNCSRKTKETYCWQHIVKNAAETIIELNNDVMLRIILYCDFQTINNFLFTCKKSRLLLKNEPFWKEKYELNFLRYNISLTDSVSENATQWLNRCVESYNTIVSVNRVRDFFIRFKSSTSVSSDIKKISHLLPKMQTKIINVKVGYEKNHFYASFLCVGTNIIKNYKITDNTMIKILISLQARGLIDRLIEHERRTGTRYCRMVQYQKHLRKIYPYI